MNEELNSQIAASLEATPELLPFIPELLADVWALGGSPEALVELLRPLGLSGTATRLLDLGCGKGAIGYVSKLTLFFLIALTDTQILYGRVDHRLY